MFLSIKKKHFQIRSSFVERRASFWLERVCPLCHWRSVNISGSGGVPIGLLEECQHFEQWGGATITIGGVLFFG